MKFTIKEDDYNVLRIEFWFNNGSRQLFYGPTMRAFCCLSGRYDFKDTRFNPEKKSWENCNIELFIKQYENGDFLGVYLLWYIARLDILQSELKTSPHMICSGKPMVSNERNWMIDEYSIGIKLWDTQCKDVDRIKSVITNALNTFDVEAVFRDMVESFDSRESRNRTTLKDLDIFKENFKKIKDSILT